MFHVFHTYPLLLTLLCVVSLATILLVVFKIERSWSDRLYVALFLANIGGALSILSSRPGFSILLTLYIMFAIIRSSQTKYRYTGINLHAYDIPYFLGNKTAVMFFIRGLSKVDFRLVGVVLSALATASAVWFFDSPICSLWVSISILVASCLGLFCARGMSHSWSYTEQFSRPVHLAKFVDSIFDSVYLLKQGGILAVGNVENSLPEIEYRPVLDTDTVRPNIILIMNESTFPPSVYDVVETPEMVKFLESQNGRRYRLRSEIFGGVSWRTEFSVLTGIPSSAYGSFAAQLVHWATGKLHHGLTRYLKNLGYATAIIYPSMKDFINIHKFYESIGFDLNFDMVHYNSKVHRHPDWVYHDRTIGYLDNHFSKSSNPAFVYCLTMSNHFPHDVFLVEDGQDYTGGYLDKNDSSFNEYIRRFNRTCRDYKDFREKLVNKFPDKPFLIVHFGDHQPPFLAEMLGAQIWTGTSDDLSDKPARAFETYFAIDAVNYEAKIDPSTPDMIEPSYLGALIVKAASLPRDEFFEMSLGLMESHNGLLYFADKDGHLASRYIQRMIHGNFMTHH